MNMFVKENVLPVGTRVDQVMEHMLNISSLRAIVKKKNRYKELESRIKCVYAI